MLILTENEKSIIGRVQVHKDYNKLMYMISTEGNRELFFRDMFSSKNYRITFEEFIEKPGIIIGAIIKYL